KPTALSPEGRDAASAEGDIITLADVSQQVPVVRAKIKTRSPVRALAYSPDGKLLAAGSDRDVSLFDAATGKQILSFQHGNGASQSVQFSPDGSQLTVTTATGAQLLLEARTGRLIKVSK
ncbi:MAG: WD40 repeat domain-containing protein, partial [Gemmataceae bacterium]